MEILNTLRLVAAPEVIRVYDSIYSSCNASVHKQIACMLNTKQQRITLQFMDLHQQKGSNDCGVISLANATALCYDKQR